MIAGKVLQLAFLASVNSSSDNARNEKLRFRSKHQPRIPKISLKYYAGFSIQWLSAESRGAKFNLSSIIVC